MAIIAKLKHAGKTLDLNAAPYALGLDFMPPALNMSVNWAEGSSANRGGAVVKGVRYQDRAWSFVVRVMGASEMETHRHERRLEEWLALAGDEDNPLQFAYAPSDAIPFEPLYGQSWMYYTIKSGYTSPARYDGKNLGVGMQVVCNMVVGPYAEGRVQQLLASVGGIYDDYIGVPGKRSRGPVSPEDTINKFPNPIFSHTTYDNGWTPIDLINSRNNDPQYIIMGDYSAELTMDVVTARFSASVNVGSVNTHTLSFFVKKIDGSAVTAADCQVYYGGAFASTYENWGNGWWRVWANFAGVAAPTGSGVYMSVVGKTIYVDGFQLEEKDYPTSLAVGDMPGCIWTDNTLPHATTSVRAAARLFCTTSLVMLYQRSPYSIRMVVKWQHANTFPADRYLFDAGSLESYHAAADDKIYVTDGTNTVSTAALAWSTGDEIVYHWVFNVDKIELYINGVVTAAVGAAFVPTASTSFYIGSNAAGTAQINATIMDFTTWDRALTATQILNDYNNINAWLNDEASGNGLTPPPWQWAIISNNRVYSYNDATHRSYLAAGSIPGTLPTKTYLNINLTAANDLIISNLPVDYIYPCNPYIYFVDCQGTVVGGRLGGEILRTSVDTAEVAISVAYDILSRYTKPLSDQKTTFFAVLADAGSNLLCRGGIYEGTRYLGYTDYASLTADATYRNFMIPSMAYPYVRKDQIANISSYTSNPLLILRFKRSTGAAANVDLDYWMVFFGATVYCPITVSEANVVIIVDGRVELYATTAYAGKGEYRGDIIELEPGKINYLTTISGPLSGANNFTGDYCTFTNIYIIPRWGLL